MALDQGTTYTDPNRHYRKPYIAEMVHFCNPSELWFMQNIVGEDRARKLFGFQGDPTDGNSWSWLEDGLAPTSARITTAATAPTATGQDCLKQNVYPDQTLQSSQEVCYFRKGDVLEVLPATETGQPGEHLYVNSVDQANNRINVRRGFNGTTAGAIPANALVCKITHMAQECPDSIDLVDETPMAKKTMYAQHFRANWKKSRQRMDHTNYFGFNSPSEYQAHMERKHFGGMIDGQPHGGEFWRDIENAVISSQNPNPGGGVPDTSSFAGIQSSFYSGLIRETAVAITPETIRDVTKRIYKAGGNPDTMLVSPEAMGQLTSWNESFIRTERTDTGFGNTLKKITTAYGELEVIMHRGFANNRTNKMFIFNKSDLAIWPVFPLEIHELPNPNTAHCPNWEAFAKYIFMMKCDCHQAMITIMPWCEAPTCGPASCHTGQAAPARCRPGVVA